MKTKTARRWLARNRWKITRMAGGDPGTQFFKQLMKCKRASGSILFRDFRKQTGGE